MQISITHNNIDWNLLIDDYDYEKEQLESGPTYDSGGEPGYPEAITLNEYYLEMAHGVFDAPFTDAINDQLAESNALCKHLLALYQDDIHDQALEFHFEEQF